MESLTGQQIGLIFMAAGAFIIFLIWWSGRSKSNDQDDDDFWSK